jgi:hypothetical protein
MNKAVSYDKKALAMFRRMHYDQAIKGHYDSLPSTNTLRNSVNLGPNLDQGIDRFKVEFTAAHHATTHYIPNSFTKGMKVYPDKDQRESSKDEKPMGRPLWQRELNKVCPPPTTYKVKREFDPLSPKTKKKNEVKCTFGATHQQL